MTPEAEQLAKVLAGDEVPWPAFFLRSDGETLVEVTAVQRLATERGLEWSPDRLDDLVDELCGRRESIIDPWSWPKRMMLRLAGKHSPTNDVYAFQRAMIDGLRNELG